MSTTTVESIHKTVTVSCSVEHAFETFADGIGSWWPLKTHSVGGDNTETAIMEPRVGGRLYERMADGSEVDWGTVLAWEPPHRLVLSWQPNPTSPTPTELEVRFTDEGGSTRVDLEHRGWEGLGDLAAQARSEYAKGWPTVIGHYAEAANR